MKILFRRTQKLETKVSDSDQDSDLSESCSVVGCPASCTAPKI